MNEVWIVHEEDQVMGTNKVYAYTDEEQAWAKAGRIVKAYLSADNLDPGRAKEVREMLKEGKYRDALMFIVELDDTAPEIHVAKLRIGSDRGMDC